VCGSYGTAMAERDAGRGTPMTFLVTVLYRQNVSWQGRIEWQETGRSVSFRTALELVCLLEQAANGTYGGNPEGCGQCMMEPVGP